MGVIGAGLRRIPGSILLLLLFVCLGEAKTHKVGDGLSWVQPPTLTTYSLWASTHVFIKGDLLEFNFNNGIHDVAEVTKDVYNKCNKSSTISINNQSPVRIVLPKRGKRYFISTLNNDCLSGLKLSIKVLNHLPPSPPPSQPPSIAPIPAQEVSNSPQTPPDTIPISTPTSPASNAATSSFSYASSFSIIGMLIYVSVL